MSAPVDLSSLAATGQAWRFACPDWIDRLMNGRSLVPELPLFADKAERAVRIFDKLRVPDIAGQPPMSEAAGDWFREIVRVTFGSLDDAGVRHVPEIFALVGKKNSKTTYGAGLMITALLVNKVPNGEFLFVAPSLLIADQAFGAARGIIEADPEGYLQKRFHIQEHKRTIRDRVTKAFLQVKTFDLKVMTGTKPIGVLIDELHVMGALHFASRVIAQIRGALQSKPNSFLLIISTQSDQPPAGVFKADLNYARAVRDGQVVNGVRMLPILYEFPERMQRDKEKKWADPAFWPMVMPNLGRSLHLDAMKAGFQAEKEKGEEHLRLWASQHLNVEIGVAMHADRWVAADYWQQAAEPMTLDALLARSEVVTVGIDGGGLDDLLGFAVMGRDKETGRWLLWNRAWCKPIVMARRKDIAERLRDFAKVRDLIVCEDPTQDVREVADIVERIFKLGLLPEKEGVGLDPVGISAIIDELSARGIDDFRKGGPVCSVFQGYRLSGAVWGMERKLEDGTFTHAGQDLMAWCLGNAKVELKGNAVLITKEVSGKAKIDPLVASLDAFFLMSRNPSPSRRDIAAFIKNPVMVI